MPTFHESSLASFRPCNQRRECPDCADRWYEDTESAATSALEGRQKYWAQFPEAEWQAANKALRRGSGADSDLWVSVPGYNDSGEPVRDVFTNRSSGPDEFVAMDDRELSSWLREKLRRASTPRPGDKRQVRAGGPGHDTFTSQRNEWKRNRPDHDDDPVVAEGRPGSFDSRRLVEHVGDLGGRLEPIGRVVEGVPIEELHERGHRRWKIHGLDREAMEQLKWRLKMKGPAEVEASRRRRSEEAASRTLERDLRTGIRRMASESRAA